MNDQDAAFELGGSIAALRMGVSTRAVPFLKAASDAIENPNTPGYGMRQRVVCRLIAGIYKEAGEMDQLGFHLYDKLSSANWVPELDRYYDIALRGLAAGGIDKMASALPGILASGVGKGVALTPDIVKTMIGAGIGTGAAAGSLYWLANRDTEEDDAKVEALRAKIRHYRQITKNISADIQ